MKISFTDKKLEVCRQIAAEASQQPLEYAMAMGTKFESFVYYMDEHEERHDLAFMNNEKDAIHFAINCPAVVVAMCDEIIRQRKMIERLRKLIEHLLPRVEKNSPIFRSSALSDAERKDLLDLLENAGEDGM